MNIRDLLAQLSVFHLHDDVLVCTHTSPSFVDHQIHKVTGPVTREADGSALIHVDLYEPPPARLSLVRGPKT